MGTLVANTRSRVSYTIVSREIYSFFIDPVNCKHGEESTCEVLRDIDNIYGDIANSSMAVCTTNGEKDCDTLICNALLGATQISHNVTILPCNDPPGIRYRQAVGGQLIINRVFTKTENYTVPGNLGTVEVTVDQLEEEIGIRVYLLLSSAYRYILHVSR